MTWIVQKPVQFIDRRFVMGNEYRANRIDHYRHVRAWRGVMARRSDDGKWEFDRCPHAHAKPAAARQCAERAARRANRTTSEIGAQS